MIWQQIRRVGLRSVPQMGLAARVLAASYVAREAAAAGSGWSGGRLLLCINIADTQ